MIQLTKDHEASKDTYGWTLRTWGDGVSRKGPNKGEAVRVSRDTYHATLEQVCLKVLDDVPDAEAPADIIKAIKDSTEQILEALNTIA